MQVNCEQISFHYDSGEEVFTDVSFIIERPGFHSIFGKSGIGKSTLAGILTGTLEPTRGKVKVPERVLCCASWEALPPWSRLSTHFEEVVGNNLPSEDSSLSELMSALSLKSDVFERYPHQISTGQAMRINLLRYCLLYTSPSPRDLSTSRMPSSA